MKLLLVCVLVAVVAAYDSNLAMSSLYYCKTAYCNVNTIQTWGCGPSCQYHSQMTHVSAFHNSTNGGQGFVGYDGASGRIVVAFRGSSDIANWIANLDFIKFPYPDPECNCEVHHGFFDVYLDLSHEIKASVRKLAGMYPSAPIHVTGHSLGAAISVFAALDMLKAYGNERTVTLYNFGLPRAGDPAFAAFACSKFQSGNHYRITHSRDPVPHVPPMDLGFLHIDHEVWYDNNLDSGETMCQDSCTAEDPNCSDSVGFTMDIKDHLLYLGICTECTCQQEELDKSVAAWRKVMPKLEAKMRKFWGNYTK